MVRVKSQVYTKASVKAPRKQTALTPASTKCPTTGKSSKYSGGNAYQLRATPDWQKPITSFFSKNGSEDKHGSKSSKYSGGNTCHLRSTPDEQKPITSSVDENVSETDNPGLFEPVPCCSKDESEHVTDEGESEPGPSSSKTCSVEQDSISNGSDECESSGSDM